MRTLCAARKTALVALLKLVVDSHVDHECPHIGSNFAELAAEDPQWGMRQIKTSQDKGFRSCSGCALIFWILHQALSLNDYRSFRESDTHKFQSFIYRKLVLSVTQPPFDDDKAVLENEKRLEQETRELALKFQALMLEAFPDEH